MTADFRYWHDRAHNAEARVNELETVATAGLRSLWDLLDSLERGDEFKISERMDRARKVQAALYLTLGPEVSLAEDARWGSGS